MMHCIIFDKKLLQTLLYTFKLNGLDTVAL